eukprot:8636511-Heterocapsa_arctica.AAC.1
MAAWECASSRARARAPNDTGVPAHTHTGHRGKPTHLRAAQHEAKRSMEQITRINARMNAAPTCATYT